MSELSRFTSFIGMQKPQIHRIERINRKNKKEWHTENTD